MITLTLKIMGTVVHRLQFDTELQALEYCRKNCFHYACEITLPDGVTYRTYVNEAG